MAIGDMVVPYGEDIRWYQMRINTETREIDCPEDFILGVESDEKAQRVAFVCPKIITDEFDISKASVYINFENANGEKDAYRVEDLEVDEELEEVTFSWLLSRKVTAYKGQVNFIVCAKISNENGVIQKEWNTTVATAISLVGLEAIAQIEQENYDILEEILRKVKNIEENGVDVDLSVYQKKTDSELKTNDKTIVGAINEIKDNQKDLPVASSTQIGGVKPVAKTEDMTQEVGVDSEGKLFTLLGGNDIIPKELELIVDFTVEEEASKYIFTKEAYPKIENLKFIYIEVNQQSTPANTRWVQLLANSSNTELMTWDSSTIIFTGFCSCIEGLWIQHSQTSTNSVYINAKKFNMQISQRFLMPKYEKIEQLALNSWMTFLNIGSTIKIYGF